MGSAQPRRPRGVVVGELSAVPARAQAVPLGRVGTMLEVAHGGGGGWWRWRESNPRPQTTIQDFSGRSWLVVLLGPYALTSTS
jgi:hypothetical protein